MQTAQLGAVNKNTAPILAGDTLIELSSIKAYDVQTMSYGYLSRICGNGFETLLSRGRRFSNNMGTWTALLTEAKQKARSGQLRYICIYTTEGTHLTVFNVGQKKEWESLLKELEDGCQPVTA